MFSCRGTIDVSIDSPRRCDDTRLFAFLGSAKNLACVFKSCESKSKGKKKRKIGREIKRLLETTFRLWREKFGFERIGLERGSSDRGECADRRRSVGWARSGIWSVARLGRWTLRGRRDAGAGTKLTGGRHAVWPCFVSDAAAAARRDALSRSTTGRPNRSAAAVSDCCDAACHAVPGRLQQDRHRKPSSSCVSLHLLTFLLTSSTSEENRHAFDLRPILLLLFSSCSLTPFLTPTRSQLRILSTREEGRGSFATLRSIFFAFPWRVEIVTRSSFSSTTTVNEDRCKSSSSSSSTLNW